MKPKLLIVYYSWSGRTQLVAETMANHTGADLFELQTVRTYPTAQKEIDSEVNRELESGLLPSLEAMPGNLNDYELVIVGGPVWMYTVATPVMRFLSESDFSGRQVAPFCTHQGGVGRYFAHFAEQVRNGETLEGLEMYSPTMSITTERQIVAWLKKAGAIHTHPALSQNH